MPFFPNMFNQRSHARNTNNPQTRSRMPMSSRASAAGNGGAARVASGGLGSNYVLPNSQTDVLRAPVEVFTSRPNANGLGRSA